MIRTLERIIEGQGYTPQSAEALGLVHSNKIIMKKKGGGPKSRRI